MGGKNTNSSSTIQIPPEVMARYNSVNATAENAAKTPFQKYSDDPNAFVANLTGTQQAAINNTNQYAGQAQPFFGAATNILNAAQQGATPYITASQNTIGNAYGQAQGLEGQAVGQYYNAANAAQPWLSASGAGYQGAQQTGSAYNQAATQAVTGGLAAATPFTMAGAQGVDPGALNTNQYMSPYMGNVVNSLLNAQQMQNAQQQSGLKGDAIKAGAFGGDRAGVAQANLGYQQNMANQQQLSNVLQSGYTQAQNTAAQQQGQQLAASQANRQAMANTGQQLYSQMTGTGQQLANIGQQAFGQGAQAAQGYGNVGQQEAGLYNQLAQGLGTTAQQGFQQGATTAQQQAALGQQLYSQGANTSQQLAALGTGSQTAGLQGAQAQMAAGQVQQQTNQAGLSALYNQFLQQQAYPFQTSQFLANIAEGTGALSGSSTTGSQSSSFFSDERLKEDIEPIGKTFDGQNIIKFRYKGDPRHQIGLSAQDTERHHPDAVGLGAHGYKMVDYDEATRGAAERGHFAMGGSALGKGTASPTSTMIPPDLMNSFTGRPSPPASNTPKGTTSAPGTPVPQDVMNSFSSAQQAANSQAAQATLPPAISNTPKGTTSASSTPIPADVQAANCRPGFAGGGAAPGDWPDLGLAPGNYTSAVDKAFATLPASPGPVSGSLPKLGATLDDASLPSFSMADLNKAVSAYADTSKDSFARLKADPVAGVAGGNLPPVPEAGTPAPAQPTPAASTPVAPLKGPDPAVLAPVAKAPEAAAPAAKQPDPAPVAAPVNLDAHDNWTGSEGGGGGNYRGGLVRADGGQVEGADPYNYPIMKGWQAGLYSGKKPGYVPTGGSPPSRKLLTADLPKASDPGAGAKEGVSTANDLTKLYKSSKDIWDDKDKNKIIGTTTPGAPATPAPGLAPPPPTTPSTPSVAAATPAASDPSLWDQATNWVSDQYHRLADANGGRVGLAGGGYMDQPGIDDLTDGERKELMKAPPPPPEGPGITQTFQSMLFGKAHGGRAGLAGGGLPYSQDEGGYMGQAGVTDDKHKDRALQVAQLPHAPPSGGAGQTISTANQAVQMGKTGKDIYNSDWFGRNFLGKTSPGTNPSVAPGNAAPTTPVTSEPLGAPSPSTPVTAEPLGPPGGASPPMNAAPLPTPPTPPVAEAGEVPGGLAGSTAEAAAPSTMMASNAAAGAAGDAAAAGATEAATAAATAAASEAAAAAAAGTTAAATAGAASAAEVAPLLLVALAKSGGYIKARRRRKFREGGAPTADDDTDMQWMSELPSTPDVDPNLESNRGLVPRRLPPQAVPSEAEPLPEAKPDTAVLKEDPAAVSRRMVEPQVTEGTPQAQAQRDPVVPAVKPGLVPAVRMAAPHERPPGPDETVEYRDPDTGEIKQTAKPPPPLPPGQGPQADFDINKPFEFQTANWNRDQFGEAWRYPQRYGTDRGTVEAIMASRGMAGPNFDDKLAQWARAVVPGNTAMRPPAPHFEDKPPAAQEWTPAIQPGLAPHEREGEQASTRARALELGLGAAKPEKSGPAGVPPTEAQMRAAKNAPYSPQNPVEEAGFKLRNILFPQKDEIPPPTNAGAPGKPATPAPAVPAAPAAPAVAAKPGAPAVPATTAAGAPAAPATPAAPRPGLAGNDNVADLLNARSLEAARAGRGYTPVGAGFDYASNAPSIPAPGLGGGVPNAWGRPTAPGTTVDGQPAFMMANARTADGSAPVPQVDQRVGQMPPAPGGLAPPAAPPPQAQATPPARGLAPPVQAPAQQQQTGEGESKPGWISRNQDWLMPLLTGIGTMASSPSRYLGSAILQGIGGAAGAYENVQSQMQERAASAAKTQAQQLANYRGATYEAPGGGFVTTVRDRNGNLRTYPTQYWLQHQEELQNAGMAFVGNSGGSDATPASAPGGAPGGAMPVSTAAPAPAADGSPSSHFVPPPPAPMMGGVKYTPESAAAAKRDFAITQTQPGQAGPVRAQSEARWRELNGGVVEAHANRNAMSPLINTIAASNDGKGWVGNVFGASGTLYGPRMQVLTAANTAARIMGLGENYFSDRDSQTEISRKLAAIQGNQQVMRSHQQGFQALSTMMSAFPTPDMTPLAATELAAKMIVTNQMPIDKQIYATRYGTDSQGILGPNFDPAADKANPQEDYLRDVAVIQKMMLDPRYKGVWDIIQKGQAKPAHIDELFAKITKDDPNGPSLNMGRYFTSGR